MLRFLLDEHLSPEIATAVHAARQDIVALSVQQWEDGQYLGADDGVLLAKAYEHDLTLVTYDQKTIAPLLVYWGQRGASHGGIVFGSVRTMPTNEFGAIARALIHMWQEFGDLDWTNRIAYLARTAER